MPHRFDPKHWQILESEWRRKILPVEPLLRKVEGLRRRDVAFDIGAGTGYFTVHLARIFKRVYAVEVSVEMAKILASKGLKNVGVIISDRPPEIDFEVDFVLFADSLHEIDCREEYIDWCCAHSYSVAVIDWKMECEFGPPREDRLDVEYVKKLLSRCFQVEDVDAYDCHFFLFGTKTS